MRNLVKILSLSLILGTAVPLSALDATSRLGAEMKMLSTPVGLGVLFGWRYLFHSSPYFSIGGAGYTGQIATGTTGSYGYGGLIGAFHIPFSSQVSMEVSILGGGGGGRLGDSTSFGGTLIEPGIGFSFKLGKAVQFVVGGSYLWMPGAASGTGASGGIKFEFLSDHRPDPVVSREPIREPVREPVRDPRVAPTPVAPGTQSSNNSNPALRTPSSTRD